MIEENSSDWMFRIILLSTKKNKSVSFFLAYKLIIRGVKEIEEAEEMAGTAQRGEFKAFLDGKAITLKEVGDGVFSEGIMGDGLAIIPENEILYAPVAAKVTVLMEESRHACGLTMQNGMEVLLHIGVDTVDMKGDGFKYLVQEGQEVEAGTPLIQFSRKKIKEAGHPVTTVCILTGEGDAQNIRFKTGIRAKAGETTVITFE